MTEGNVERRTELATLIRGLARVQAPSGSETAIRDHIRELVAPYAASVQIDALGNLIATAPRSRPSPGAAGAKSGGRARRIMLAAHMDEIGVIVVHIDEHGFLRVRPVGGVSPLLLLGQRVRFTNGTLGVVNMDGTSGIVGLDKLERLKDINFDKLYVDIGAESKEEAARRVQVGDTATMWHEVEEAGEHRLVGKALDNRAGCAVAVQALRELAAAPGPHEVHFVFTVQEEVGLRGAGPAAFGLEPELALAIDTTGTGDTPEATALDVSLGKGVAIKVQDRSVLAHRGIKELLVETARANGIPYQLEVLPFGGTDAGSIHLTRAGVPSGVISLPTRYLHSTIEMVDLRDLDAAVSLLLAFLRRDSIEF